MKKKIVAVMLAGAMIASQFMGVAEAFAASTLPEEVVKTEGRETQEGVVSPLNDGVKAIYKKNTDNNNNRIFRRDDSDVATSTEITAANEKATITDLLIASDVVNIPQDVFANNNVMSKLVFAEADSGTAPLTMGNAIFYNASSQGKLTEVVLPERLTTLGNSVFKGQVLLSNIKIGSKLASVGYNAFEGTTALTQLDLRNARALTTLRGNAFKGGALKKLVIGKNTKVIDKHQNDAGLFLELASTVTDRIVHFVGDDNIYLEGSERATLEANWEKLKQSTNGSWKFFADKEATPNASIGGRNTKLVGLESDGKYQIVVTDATNTSTEIVNKEVVADGSGEIAFENGWADQTIKIYKKATSSKLESDTQTVPAYASYKVTVDGTDHPQYSTVEAGDTITLTADEKKGDDTFASWTITPESVQVADKTQRTITFTMPEENVTATTTYLAPGTTPTAVIDRQGFKLTGLTASATYNVRVKAGGEAKQVVADGEGNIPLSKEWGGKNIYLSLPGTTTAGESKPQTIFVPQIYTVTVDGTKQEDAVVETTITLTAKNKTGYKFLKWDPAGTVTTIVDPAAESTTFIMPSQDVIITTVYKKIAEAPVATVDYASMKLKGLVPDAVYSITPGSDQAEELVADGEGAIAIKKAWSEKALKIVKKETEEETESPAQDLAALKKIHTILVDEIELISVEAQQVTVKAPTPLGSRFEKWETVEGITVTDDEKLKGELTFTMPAGDVKLVASYVKVVTSQPEELVYNGGEAGVSVKLDIPLDEFKGIQVGGEELVKDTDYTIAEDTGVTTLAGGIIVTFTKTYLDKLENGDQAFQVVLKDDKTVDFEIKVEKPETSEKPEDPEKPAKVYPDVKADDWFAGAVGYVDAKGYMTGYANGNFGPADVLGRGQFATILHRIGGSPVVEYSNAFADVQDGHFYSLPVVWAKSNKYITGYENGNFGPADSITREQLATMLYRHATIKGEVNVSARAGLEGFPDAGNVSGFAKEAISWAVAEGIISGDNGKLNPQGESSRAVVATMIQRLEKVGTETPATPTE